MESNCIIYKSDVQGCGGGGERRLRRRCLFGFPRNDFNDFASKFHLRLQEVSENFINLTGKILKYPNFLSVDVFYLIHQLHILKKECL